MTHVPLKSRVVMDGGAAIVGCLAVVCTVVSLYTVRHYCYRCICIDVRFIVCVFTPIELVDLIAGF